MKRDDKLRKILWNLASKKVACVDDIDQALSAIEKLDVADESTGFDKEKAKVLNELVNGTPDERTKCKECNGTGEVNADRRGIDGNVCDKCGGTGMSKGEEMKDLTPNTGEGNA